MPVLGLTKCKQRVKLLNGKPSSLDQQYATLKKSAEKGLSPSLSDLLVNSGKPHCDQDGVHWDIAAFKVGDKGDD